MGISSRQQAALNNLPKYVPALAADQSGGVPIKLGDMLSAMQREALSAGVVARIASTVNIASLAGLAARDSVTPVSGDVILVKDQNTAAQNGLYVAQVGAWTRLKDSNGNDVTNTVGLAVKVAEGGTQADTSWLLTNNAPIVTSVDNLTFVQVTTSGVSTIDLASNSVNKGASLVGIQDAAGIITATNVETALLEIVGSRFRAQITVTTVEAAAGKTILADGLVVGGAKVYVDDVKISVGGGTVWAGTHTKLIIQDTNGSPVEITEVAKASLSANAVIASLADAGFTNKVGLVTGGTANKGLTIISDGTCTAGSTLTVRVTGRIL